MRRAFQGHRLCQPDNAGFGSAIGAKTGCADRSRSRGNRNDPSPLLLDHPRQHRFDHAIDAGQVDGNGLPHTASGWSAIR
ncbi:MAG: hypothetical protein R3E79_58045 [Caldilineaceae bacterium]